MPSYQRNAKRRKTRSASTGWLAAATTLAVALIAVAVVVSPKRSAVGAARLGRVKLPETKTQTSLRPVYRYSVIPGGAYTPQELRQKLESDVVAAEHYESFDLEHVRTVRAHPGRPVYVSYRKGRSIFWTRRPTRLAADEILLTDGAQFARARCGNRISETRQEPVAQVPEAEPSDDLLEVPEFWEPIAPALPALTFRPSLPGWQDTSGATEPHGGSSSTSGAASATPRLLAGPVGLPGSGVPLTLGTSPVVSPPGTGSSSSLVPAPVVPSPPAPGTGSPSSPVPAPVVPSPPAPSPSPLPGPIGFPPYKPRPDPSPAPGAPSSPEPSPTPEPIPVVPSPPGTSPGLTPTSGAPSPLAPPEDPDLPPSPEEPSATLPEPHSFALLLTVIATFGGLRWWRYRSARAKLR
jgi:hypothetical protein